MAKPPGAPQCDTSSKSDALYYIDNVGGAISANFNLTTVTLRPFCAPQKTTLWVDSAAAAIVLVDEDDITHTITVPAGAPLVLTRPFRQITDSGSGDVNVIFEWFDPGASVPRNP